MAKFLQILFATFLLIALCSAAVPHSRSSRLQARRLRSRLARQELEVVTPYPTADELKPEVPFEETPVTTDELKPEVPSEETPITTDELKPEVTFDETPIATDDLLPRTPDEVYGPPEEEAPIAHQGPAIVEEENAIAAEEVANAEEETIASSRLTARRGAVRKTGVRPAKLRKSAASKLRKSAPAKLRKSKNSRLQVKAKSVNH